MITIDADGMCIHPKVVRARKPAIERGRLSVVHGIIVHQTGAPTTESTMNSYLRRSATGAHFLLAREGTVYQTASLHHQTWHVGLLRSRCLVENRCAPAELRALRSFNPQLEDRREQAKNVPDRFPANRDSIGIELVGDALPRAGHVRDDQRTYEFVTTEQNAALRWLTRELSMALGVPMHEVFRHPQVSRKNPTEASSAQW